VEDWGVEGAAVGRFLGWEEGDEFAVEPDYAVGYDGQYGNSDDRLEGLDAV
jgi:hypothetical protein